mgnify:CR=1 FL=1
MTKRVLVTGVNGQVGSAIMALKHDYSFDFIYIERADWDMAKNPKSAYELIRKNKPDLVINPAAYTNVDQAEEEQETAYIVNATAVGELAKACKESNIPLLHLSTDYVFDGTKKTPYTEKDRINPINFYGKSKADGEKLIYNILQQYIILRTSWIFSNTGNNFVNTMRRLGRERDELKVVNDQQGGPTPASCIAKVLLEISLKYLTRKIVPWGLYHYSGEPAVTWYDFADRIFQSSIESERPKLIPCTSADFFTKASRPHNSVMSSTLIKKVMGVGKCNWKEKLNENK